MTATEDRDRVADLSKRDPAGAHAAARKIREPWFRAQALGWVARYADNAAVVRIAKEALTAGRKCADRYQAVGSAAWPIRAMIERGKDGAARRALDSLGPDFRDIEPASSRSEAVFLLYQAAFDLGPEVREPLLTELAATQAADDHWRPARNLVDSLHMLAAEAREPDRAREIAAAISDDRTRRKALTAIDGETILGPRPFFW